MGVRFLYTPDHLAFLKEAFKTMRCPQLTAAFNDKFRLDKTPGQIKSCLKNNGYKCGRPPGFKKGEISNLNEKQLRWLTSHYKTMTQLEITQAFNNKFNTTFSVKAMAGNLKRRGIKCGRTGQFEKGHISWNNGTKGRTSTNKTSFKNGSVPANIKPLGHERICTQNGYLLIKIAEKNPYTSHPTRYKAKHIVVWEQHNGPVPEKHMLTFIDGDKLNCDIENLECINKAENVQRNKLQYSKQPAELQPVVRTLAKVITQTHEKERENAK